MAAREPRTYRDLIADCVHCGFCLPACPTYRSWGDEMDSPRGRIDLMKGIADANIPLDATVVGHFDACLGCMACVPACPSGVRYDLLIETTRAKVEDHFVRQRGDRWFRALIFALFPYPRRLRVLAWPLFVYAALGLQQFVRRSGLARLFPRRLAQLDALLPSIQADVLTYRLPQVTKARGKRRGRVALVAGCVQRVFFPNVNAATIRVLAAEGFDVIVPSWQGCCGALSLHAGRDQEAKRFARALIERFNEGDVDAIVINAAGCGSTLKQYGELLATEPSWEARARAFSERVRDVTEFLADRGLVAERGPLKARVAYHDACHLANAQRIREQPRTLLAAVPELELLEIPDGDQCCGSAGIYNLVQPQSAEEIGERKVDNVISVAPDIVASGNPGCTLQFRALLAKRGRALSIVHPIELLDQSLFS
ncbi:MAG: 4Fe-4S dicluster domain-containing protein [Candidatus Eremiobacteraeota bacterium]|nr:4Fe-4S dicluster domain-containing protein [Candidatus Eremiobacteraeota bacterium]